MDLKTLLGDAYKDDMTIEDIDKALKGKELVDPSTLPKSVKKEDYDKLASDHAQLKKDLKALKEASETIDEKHARELQEAADLKGQLAKQLAQLRAEKVFAGAGLDEQDYAGILNLVVSEDGDITELNAKNMVSLFAAQKKAAEEAVKAELIKNNPKPGAGVSPGTMTKENFDKLSSDQQMEFIKTNPNWKEIIVKE